ncbi:peptide/nickel transport system permease protein [Quadrisphaera granulorum]|uniref:Peptide/nickel transport system permease protein n=1 Tax=Quadrisphaera granulorum TaxID=317664 RepID=A0A315ZVD0_9ACTN|nr:ABC transporter permease [Quadrisphaera granulorum]PWJ49571.1 peptide/nickel transport system permease protein [Quadrisphaera granulorum]SZE98150.1 peptide/nickel transport system permease protein [Quadrisphaera granulorum]
MKGTRVQAGTAVVLLAVLVLLAVAGIFLRGTATTVDVANALVPPGPGHWFGTDAQGRDVFARVAVGTSIALASGLGAVAVGGGLGLVIALVCGLGPRWLDAVLVRLLDAVMAFPALLLALAVTMAFGTGLLTALVGVVVTVVPVFARTLRAEARRATSEPFVQAARTIGLSTPHLAVRHVVPYLGTTFSVQTAANVGNVILVLSGLSFIGVGAQPPTPEWGAMITEGLQNALTGQWWIGVFPGLALLVTVVAVNLLADSIPAVRAARLARRRTSRPRREATAPAPVEA